MPYYEYRCATSGRTVEVRHGMSESPTTWGELAALGADSGGAPAHARVERLISKPVPPSGTARADVGGCGAGCACAPQH